MGMEVSDAAVEPNELSECRQVGVDHGESTVQQPSNAKQVTIELKVDSK